MKNYQDNNYQKKIFRIIIYKAKIEYCRLKQKIISFNLLLATNNPNILIINLENQILVNKLIKVSI